MSDRPPFEYLLNQMELAASADEPANEDYEAKRKAVLGYVAALVEKMDGKDRLLVAYRLGSHQRADTALRRIEKADAKLEALEARTRSANV